MYELPSIEKHRVQEDVKALRRHLVCKSLNNEPVQAHPETGHKMHFDGKNFLYYGKPKTENLLYAASTVSLAHMAWPPMVLLCHHMER